MGKRSRVKVKESETFDNTKCRRIGIESLVARVGRGE